MKRLMALVVFAAVSACGGAPELPPEGPSASHPSRPAPGGDGGGDGGTRLPSPQAIPRFATPRGGALGRDQVLSFAVVTPGRLSTQTAWLTNLGDADYTVSAIAPAAGPAISAFGLPDAGLRVAPGAVVQLSFTFHPSGVGTFAEDLTLRLTGPGTADQPLHLALRGTEQAPNCLLVTPDDLDLGPIFAGCHPERNVTLYDICAAPQSIEDIALDGAAAFSVVGPPSPSTVPASQSITLKIRYAPELGAADGGIDHARLSVRSTDGGSAASVTLRGSLAPPVQQIDTYRQDTLPRSDVLIVLDDSPSMLGHGDRVFQQLDAILDRADVDNQVAVTTMSARADPTVVCDGGAGRCGQLRSVPGAPAVISNRRPGWLVNPDFAGQLAARVTPTGTGSSAAMGLEAAREALSQPALEVDAGFRRDGVPLSVVFISDAPDQSPDSVEAYAAALDGGLPGRTFVQAFAPVDTGPADSTCAYDPDAVFNDRYAQVMAAFGESAPFDFCASPWPGPGEAHFVLQEQAFRLSETPDLSAPIEVRVDGVWVSASFVGDGGPVARWAYDPTDNAVVFADGHIPDPGSLVTFAYRAVPRCN